MVLKRRSQKNGPAYGPSGRSVLDGTCIDP